MSRIVVASLYKGFPENGGFNKEGAKLVRSNMKIMEDWVNEVNANFQHNGEFYVIDEDATQERLDVMKGKINLELNPNELNELKFSEGTGVEMVESKEPLMGVALTESELEAKKEAETDFDLEALKVEYKELSGVDPKGNWGVKKLTEEIEKLKN